MAIIIRTKSPSLLVEKIKNFIDNQIIISWEYDSDEDFTVASEQWRLKAWMHIADVDEKKLVFGIISSKKYRMTKELYGVYHGLFLATLLSHFDTEMDSIDVTPLADKKFDIVGQ